MSEPAPPQPADADRPLGPKQAAGLILGGWVALAALTGFEHILLPHLHAMDLFALLATPLWAAVVLLDCFSGRHDG